MYSYSLSPPHEPPPPKRRFFPKPRKTKAPRREKPDVLVDTLEKQEQKLSSTIAGDGVPHLEQNLHPFMHDKGKQKIETDILLNSTESDISEWGIPNERILFWMRTGTRWMRFSNLRRKPEEGKFRHDLKPVVQSRKSESYWHFKERRLLLWMRRKAEEGNFCLFFKPVVVVVRVIKRSKSRRYDHFRIRMRLCLRKRKLLFFNDLPEDIITSILIRLPTITLLHCKRVCKQWRDIISKPTFADTHYEKSRISLASSRHCDPYERGLIVNESYISNIGWQEFQCLQFNLGFMEDDIFTVINSCRGLLLLTRFPIALYICNPFTNQHLILPKEGDIFTPGESLIGLGFCQSTEEYKVVCFRKLYNTYHTRIYTIGTDDYWRSVDCPCHILLDDERNLEDNYPIEVNGFLHWLVKWRGIARFNIETEELEPMPLPCHTLAFASVVTLGVVLGGMLCMGTIPIKKDMGILFSREAVEMWVMKDYGKESSWTPYVVVDLTMKFDGALLEKLPNFKLIEYEPWRLYYNRGALVLKPDGEVSSYKSKTRKRDYEIDGSHEYMLPRLYVPSFFRVPFA